MKGGLVTPELVVDLSHCLVGDNSEVNDSHCSHSLSG